MLPSSVYIVHKNLEWWTWRLQFLFFLERAFFSLCVTGLIRSNVFFFGRVFSFVFSKWRVRMKT
jgi:hypothetical protein